MKKTSASVLATAILLVSVTSVVRSAHASWFDDLSDQFLGKCGVPGVGTARVINDLNTTVSVAIEKSGPLGGLEAAELMPGQTLTTAICNRDGIRVKVYTPKACGRTFISESRFSRVYNEETVHLSPDGFRFSVGRFIDLGSRISGFALTFIAGGYGVPPELLAAMGVNEAEIVSACTRGGPASCAVSIYKKLPEDLFTTIKADSCLSAAFGIGK